MITRYKALYATNEGIFIELSDFVTELISNNDIVNQIRNETNKEKRDRLKKELPSFVFSGTFSQRSNNGLINHSGYAILDFDKIPTKEYNNVYIQLTKIPYVVLAFKSPSGNGIKIVIKIPECNPKEHELRLRTFSEYFGNEYLDLDTDICRLCFMSYDPNPYVNESSEVFMPMLPDEYFTNKTEYNNDIVNAITDEDKIIKIISRFKRSTTFEEGTRNRHIFNLASQFCEYGISQEKTISYCKNIWSTDFEAEGIKAIKSAYKIRKFNTKKLENKEVANKFQYPYEIFPQKIRESLFDVAHELSLNPTFLATSGLFTISSLAGNNYISPFGESVKNILFCLMIAPVSVGKTPAYKTMCEYPMRFIYEKDDLEYENQLAEWNREKSETKDKNFSKPKPRRFHPFAVDGTTEGYIALHQDQASGIGIYHDEAETILNAGAHKSNNDAISFFTQAFSGGRYTQIRADRDKERVVNNLNINLLMGTQPSRLSQLFPMDKIQSGFASRFLLVQSDYIELNTDIDPFGEKRTICNEWVNIISMLYHANKLNSTGKFDKIPISITTEAKELYRKYHKNILSDANKRISDKIEEFIIGTEAKMSAYLPRLIQLVSILNNPIKPEICANSVELGWKLYRFYAQSTVNIIKSLHTEVETGLPNDLENLYSALPEEFTFKESEVICKKINLPENRFRTALRRKDFKGLFTKIEHGKYKKVH